MKIKKANKCLENMFDFRSISIDKRMFLYYYEHMKKRTDVRKQTFVIKEYKREQEDYDMSKKEQLSKQRLRIQQVKRQKFFIGILAVCFALIMSIKAAAFSSEARSNDEPVQKYKYYKSIQINTGDTLWNIAKENMTAEYDSITDYIKEVKEINNLTNDYIISGSYLTIPYYDSEFK